MEDTFEIIDDKGVIYSGYTEEETRHIFQAIIDSDEDTNGWEGDLKLIEVHSVHR